MKHGASTTRNFRHFGHFAMMWRTFWLLSLMLFMSDFPHERFVSAESTRVDSSFVASNNQYKELVSPAAEETQRGVPDENNGPSKIAGSWRNNGEALEPKWRDGDIAPLLPWVHLVQYARDGLETVEHTHNDQPDRKSPEKTVERLSRQDNAEDYEPASDTEKYNRRNKYIYQRRNNDREESRVSMSLRVPNNDEREKRKSQSKDVTSVRYSEAFQVYPNAYEQELDDEEYLRPRPRKRRPPQNYEFALAADEASLRDKNRKTDFKSWPDTSIQQDKAETIDSKLKNIDKSQISQNAVELKSLLKMQQKEGLSLSELLQRKNLTLNDLLKGKADAISILKSKDSTENDEFIEEAPKMVSNSLMTLTTELPEFNHTKQEDKLSTLNVNLSAKSESNDQYPHHSDTDTVKTSLKLEKVKSTNNIQNHTVDKTILHTLNPVEEKVSTTNSPLMIITPTYSLIPTDISETTPNDDSNIGTENSRDIKYSLDEDEIMEFSDFPGFRKEKNSGSPIWITLRDEPKIQSSSVKPLQSTSKDKTSTLSIEHILSSTKRTPGHKYSSIVSNKQPPVNLFTTKTDELIDGKSYSILNQDDTNDYGTLEHEYQDDAAVILDENRDETRNTSMDSKDNEMVKVMEKIQSTLAEISRKNNLSVENEKAILKPVQSFNQGSSKNHRASNVKDKRYEDIVSEIELEARAEIFELFASSCAGKRLERLLKSRNMSVEELIALRQRGSSKVHLAEVSRLRVQKVDTTSPRVDGRSKSDIQISLALQPEEPYIVNNDRKNLDGNRFKTHSKMNAKSTLHESTTKNKEHNESTTNSTNLIHQDEGSTGPSINAEQDTNSKHDGTTFNKDQDETLKQMKQQLPDRMVQVVDLLTTFASLPFAKNIYQDFVPKFTGSDESENWQIAGHNNDPKENKINDQVVTMQFDSNSPKMIESDFTEQIIKDKSNSIDIRTLFCDTCLTDTDEDNRDEERKSLSRVRSSIIASGAILGVTVVVFLAIFIACRVRQKQKYRYRNTFSRAVFQGPMLAARKLSNSSSLSNVMVDVIATSTTKRLERCTTPDNTIVTDPKSDIDSDSLDANDSWETIPDYMK